MFKDFNKSFGISFSLEEEKTAFINRCAHFVQDLRKIIDARDGSYENVFSFVCVQLGLNANEIISQNSFLHRFVPNLTLLFNDDFINTLKVLMATRSYYEKDAEMIALFDDLVHGILDMANVDLGISYRAGVFLPKGEELLDTALIEYSLEALQKFPNENQDLINALDNYRTGTKYGVIENCYKCLEGLFKVILKNNETLINNKREILSYLKLSDHWKRILAAYIDYGNDFGRHAHSGRHNFSATEVEAYLYQTCLFIRLIIKASQT